MVIHSLFFIKNVEYGGLKSDLFFVVFSLISLQSKKKTPRHDVKTNTILDCKPDWIGLLGCFCWKRILTFPIFWVHKRGK